MFNRTAWKKEDEDKTVVHRERVHNSLTIVTDIYPLESNHIKLADKPDH